MTKKCRYGKKAGKCQTKKQLVARLQKGRRKKHYLPKMPSMSGLGEETED